MKDPQVHRPQIGKFFKLTCDPPYSYPSAVYWGINRPGAWLTPINTDDRVDLDYDGMPWLTFDKEIEIILTYCTLKSFIDVVKCLDQKILKQFYYKH